MAQWWTFPGVASQPTLSQEPSKKGGLLSGGARGLLNNSNLIKSRFIGECDRGEAWAEYCKDDGKMMAESI